MHVSTVLSMAAVFLLAGCAQPGANDPYARGAREGQGRFAGYNAYQPLPGDPPVVVQELAAAKADSTAAGAAMRMGDRTRAMQLSEKAMAELQDAQKKREPAVYSKELQLLRAIDAGQVPEQPGMSRAAAQEMLGEFYQNGSGVQQDYAAARFWYEKAIRTQADGFEVNKARTRLAYLLGQGLGGPRDPGRAHDLIRRAGLMTQADAIAQEKEREAKFAAFMAALSATGQGTTRQEEQAPSMFACHAAIGSAPSIAGMMGCPPWSP
jgi:TPR repeat protein